MKILSKRSQNEIYKRIAAGLIIAFRYCKDAEALDYLTQSLAAITMEIGGMKGAEKVKQIIDNQVKRMEE